ncbi:MAG: hypothetical protein ACRDZ4_03700 [Egibacteraceae bacterium]
MDVYSSVLRLRPSVGGEAVKKAGTPERLVCSGCGQAKTADGLFVVRGSLWHGDWLAQPCGDCCRWRVAAHMPAAAPAELSCDERPQP